MIEGIVIGIVIGACFMVVIWFVIQVVIPEYQYRKIPSALGPGEFAKSVSRHVQEADEIVKQWHSQRKSRSVS